MAPRPTRKAKLKRTSNDDNSKKDSKKPRTEDTFSSKKCTQWFEEYSRYGEGEKEPNVIGPEGIEKFCKDLDVAPENIAMLVIAWKMDAKRMGFFAKDEWLKGFSELQCDCNTKLCAKIDSMKSILQDNFKSIYRFAYDFARDKDQRSMDTETAKEMLYLLLGKQWKLYPQFHQFLEQSKYKVINKDQWYNILEFSRTISNDLSNYDVDGAWPVMLDEFVEWLRNSRAQDPMMAN